MEDKQQKIYIHQNTVDLYSFDESVDRLYFYGYDVHYYDEYHGRPFDEDGMIIDKRFPSWRGWRSVMADIDWRHYDKRVEYNRLVDKPSHCMIEYDEDSDCYS